MFWFWLSIGRIWQFCQLIRHTHVDDIPNSIRHSVLSTVKLFRISDICIALTQTISNSYILYLANCLRLLLNCRFSSCFTQEFAWFYYFHWIMLTIPSNRQMILFRWISFSLSSHQPKVRMNSFWTDGSVRYM